LHKYLVEAKELYQYSQALRRDFHRYPELGFREFRTSGIVAKELRSLGLEVSTGIAETGVVTLIEGSQPGPVVMLRFDMDALPIIEETGASYASENDGIMHACGHDGHTAIGLTVARILNNHRGELNGTFKLVFQPAEEALGGAERMVKEGVLEDPRPDAALGLHLWNDKPVGWVGVTAGPVMAAAELFKIKITGKGGHGAAPHLTVDPVLASAQIVNSLQSIVSRNVDPLDTAVVSVTAIQSGDTYNVIPPSAVMKGTIRTFKPDVRERVVSRFNEIVGKTAEAMGCQVEIDVNPLAPAVINDQQISAMLQKVVDRVLPDDTLSIDERTMGSEDMAFLMQDLPGCFIFVGSANSEKGLDYSHHHPKFDIDEESLPRGAALLAAAAVDLSESWTPR